MFKPSSDRLDYSQILAPPAGYETVFALGTTYSLDLDALIGACIALGLSESTDSALKDNPLYLLEALRKTSDKLIVFCEAGQIKAPGISNKLHLLLEKMVVEIVMQERKSFHPKLWVVKYVNAMKDTLYRCVVLSRNLTFDRSWDVSVCIEGKPVFEANSDKTKPLSDFLIALTKHVNRSDMDKTKKKSLSSLSTELQNVEFQLESKIFTDFSFCPVGISGYSKAQSGLFKSYNEMLIVSPFLTGKIVSEFNTLALTSPQPNTLITRKTELAKLKPEEVSRFNLYVMKDMVIDGEESLSEGDNDDKQSQDIHAKLYLKTKNSDSELYIGSLNATHNAVNGNIEFMLKLAGKRRNLNVEAFKQDLFGADDRNCPFERVELKPEDDLPTPDTENLDVIIKAICRLKSSAKVLESGDKYSVELSLTGYHQSDNVFISPLMKPGMEQNLTATIRFDNLDPLELSEFYIIRVTGAETNLKRVIKINTENMPDNRESMIANSIIRNKSDFIQYITFILGDNYLISMLENANQAGSYKFDHQAPAPALYEKMLKTAAHAPGKLDEIKKILELITDDSKIPDGFKELYDLFTKVVKKNAGKTKVN
ncbi:MAG: phospholipase D family protein [Candidatus Cloacimonetes bacterium]|nr:phospholipase D family protein [Candidatus Cloacimonadota bacterium]